nr:spore germination protein [Bacillus sp. UNC438CL73TsuS30]
MRELWKRKKMLGFKKFDSLLSPPIEGQLSSDLFVNEQVLQNSFHNCSDFMIRTVSVTEKTKILFIYLDGLTDSKTLDEVLLKPLLLEVSPNELESVFTLKQMIEQKILAASSIKSVSKVNELVNCVLKGNIGILLDGEPSAIIAGMQKNEQRNIEEPQTEVSIRGPRDGFTESLKTNLSLLRRRIRSIRLKFESFTIGELSQTDVTMAYIEGIAPDSLLREVRKRVEQIQIDGVLESGFIEEFIEDVPFSPFPQIQNTERPDIVSANLLEGKIAIIVDNTPFVLILPMTFWSGLQAVEDYYERFLYTSFVRVIRYILFNIALFLPSVYVALTTYHPQLIPTSLLISVAAAREGVPFPAFIEAFIMEIVFEGLREAGIRLPKAVGSAVSIVGALVIGQAAVQAGIVSAPMVIVVATTGIASFAIPRYNLGTAVRMIRFIMLVLAGVFGFYGIVVGFIALTIHLVNLRSFGVPYFSPVAPQIWTNLKDVLIRPPRWKTNNRPALISGKDKKRIPAHQKPGPKRS